MGSCGWGVGEPRPETAFGAVRVAAGAGISVVCAKDVGIAKEEEEEREVRVTVEGSDGLAGFEGFGGGRRWVASSRAEADQLVKVDDGAIEGAGVPVEEATEGDPAVVVAAATGEGAGIIIIVVLADGG